MIVYHYHAKCTRKSGEIVHTDGIAQMPSPIKSVEDYRQLKALIGANIPDIDTVAIHSMSNIS